MKRSETKKRACRERGRPRDPSIDERVLEKALSEMASKGFSRMSMEGVAAAAQVPKPTVYRRWGSKADLATTALRRLQASEPKPRGKTTPDRLTSILSSFRKNLLRPNGMSMIGSLLVEEGRHPELLALFRERIVVPRRKAIRDEIQAGIERGEVRDDIDLEAAVNALVGSFYARYLTGSPPPATWPRRVVKLVWDGIRTC